VSEIDSTREHLIETYRRRARRYDITSQLYYPQRAHRRRAIEALRLRPGDTVVEIACGTGLNFPLIEQKIGPEGRIVGVDLTDAMLAQAQQRVDANGWSNVTLVQADAAEFEFPTGVDAILATYPHALLPRSGQVIARGAAALSPGGRWVVLDLKVPDNLPRWLARLASATVGRSTSLDEWIARRPWEAIRVAMQNTLADLSWTELFFGIAYLAVGSSAPVPGRGQHRARAMAIRTESRITIAGSVQDVWTYVCDVGRWPEWAPTVLECRVRGGGPLQPGSRVEQRAKGILWLTRHRSQEVTAVEAPRHVAFAGPMGTSAARWGMELAPVDDRQTEAEMWIEVDLGGPMRAIPAGILTGRIQRVSDREMAAIKAAVESAEPKARAPSADPP
jgi:ubiquinone/menaquinone biosynthesis C-methylase UbiE